MGFHCPSAAVRLTRYVRRVRELRQNVSWSLFNIRVFFLTLCRSLTFSVPHIHKITRRVPSLPRLRVGTVASASPFVQTKLVRTTPF